MQLDQENNLSVYSEFACDKGSVGTGEFFFFAILHVFTNALFLFQAVMVIDQGEKSYQITCAVEFQLCIHLVYIIFRTPHTQQHLL